MAPFVEYKWTFICCVIKYDVLCSIKLISEPINYYSYLYGVNIEHIPGKKKSCRSEKTENKSEKLDI
jgi:hypothetical protein